MLHLHFIGETGIEYSGMQMYINTLQIVCMGYGTKFDKSNTFVSLSFVTMA